MPKEKIFTRVKRVYLNNKLADDLEELAKQEGKTESALVRESLIQYIKRKLGIK